MRYIGYVSNPDDIYGTVYSVDAPSDQDAFDLLCDEFPGQDVNILGTPDDLIAFANHHRALKTADFTTKGA